MTLKFLKTIFILAFCTSLVYGQDGDKKEETFIHLRSGFFLDDVNDKNYSGFNLVNFGWSNLKKKRIQSLEIEAIVINSKVYSKDQIDQRRRSLEHIYSHSFLLSKGADGLILGPTASLFFYSDKFNPINSFLYPTHNIYATVGIGANAAYNWRIGKKIILDISSRITLLDIGINNRRVDNPILQERLRSLTEFHMDFIRPQYQLMLGVKLKR